MTAADFPNINTLTKVGNHFVGNLLGHLDAALAVARLADGRRRIRSARCSSSSRRKRW